MLHTKIIDASIEKIEISNAENFLNSSKFGAVIYFVGTVRDNNENKEVTGITYDTKDSMVIKSFEGIYEELDPENELFIGSSDHGNLEDLYTKSHTETPVPTFLYGRSEELAAKSISRLYDIPRFILKDNDVPFEQKPEIA